MDRVNELSVMAKHRNKPSGMKLWDMWLYTVLEKIYKDYVEGSIDTDTGKAQKQHAVAEYMKSKELMDYIQKMAYHYADLEKRTEQAKNRYIKNRTIENANAIIEAMDGIKI